MPAVSHYFSAPCLPSLSSSSLRIFISYFAAFLRIDLLSELSTESIPHIFAYMTFTMDFWPFDVFWPCWWNTVAYMISSHPAMSPRSLHLSWVLTSCLSSLNTTFNLHSFIAEHRSSFFRTLFQHVQFQWHRSLCHSFFFCFVKYFFLHVSSKASFPLYRLIVLYFFSTSFYSLALPKAISFPSHQIIFMHSNLWTIIEISYFRSRETK